MNKLILIGNGFDLAHGLKTKYNDFILWFFNKVLKKLSIAGKYSNKLIEIEFTRGILPHFPKSVDSLSELKSILNKFGSNDYISYKFNCSLFNILFRKTIDLKWIDIESEYYSLLKSMFIALENNNFENLDEVENNLIKLNENFEYLKVKLQEYLISVDSGEKKEIPDITNHFKLHFSKLPNDNTHFMFLNFNYTSTIELYFDYMPHNKYRVNYIHGKLNDDTNPIIFGYGDEVDSYYQKIENLNNNEFLRNFKSFGYFINSNYQNLSGFLNNNQYEVYIFGHSCGISDRLMLKQIVEHERCRKIKIFYHERDQNDNDFIEKTQELSRHFSPNTKGRMRNLIEPLSNSVPLVKCKTIEKE